jgi:hypothetical protein
MPPDVLTQPAIGTRTGDSPGDGRGGIRIRCPKCQWTPRAEDRWACRCGHTWNTFDTGGVCPSCLYQWTVTQCLRCGEFSPHSDWYGEE